MKRPLYNIAVFREMDEEEPGALKSIVDVFLQSTPTILETIILSYRENDLESIANQAHKLKSTIDLFSINDLKAPIRQLEQLARSAQPSDEIPALIEKIHSTFQLVFEEIRKEIIG